jgi:hypothetical protein
MTQSPTPETDAAAAGADIELTGEDEPGGQHGSRRDSPLTTDEQAQDEDSPVQPGNS